MSMNCSLRVFRRNTKKLILLWNPASMPDGYLESISVFLSDSEGDVGPLSFSRFKPDNPEKFQSDIDGIVIPHGPNKMDPLKPCTIKVLFGEGDDCFEIVKDVLPASASPLPVVSADSVVVGAKAMLMYGMDYRTGKWIPFPVHSDIEHSRDGDE